MHDLNLVFVLLFRHLMMIMLTYSFYSLIEGFFEWIISIGESVNGVPLVIILLEFHFCFWLSSFHLLK